MSFFCHVVSGSTWYHPLFFERMKNRSCLSGEEWEQGWERLRQKGVLQTSGTTAGAKACGEQHCGTLKDPKEGECNEVFVQQTFVECLFVYWALC